MARSCAWALNVCFVLFCFLFFFCLSKMMSKGQLSAKSRPPRSYIEISIIVREVCAIHVELSENILNRH